MREYFAVCGNGIKISSDERQITKISSDCNYRNKSLGAIEMKYGDGNIYKYRFKIDNCPVYNVMIGISGNDINAYERLYGEYDYHYRSMVQHKKPSQQLQSFTTTFREWIEVYMKLGNPYEQPIPSGIIWSDSAGSIYCDTYDTNDEIDMIVDMKENIITFCKNDKEQGTLDLISSDDQNELITYRMAVSLRDHESSVSLINCR